MWILLFFSGSWILIFVFFYSLFYFYWGSVDKTQKILIQAIDLFTFLWTLDPDPLTFFNNWLCKIQILLIFLQIQGTNPLIFLRIRIYLLRKTIVNESIIYKFMLQLLILCVRLQWLELLTGGGATVIRVSSPPSKPHKRWCCPQRECCLNFSDCDADVVVETFELLVTPQWRHSSTLSPAQNIVDSRPTPPNSSWLRTNFLKSNVLGIASGPEIQ